MCIRDRPWWLWQSLFSYLIRYISQAIIKTLIGHTGLNGPYDIMEVLLVYSCFPITAVCSEEAGKVRSPCWIRECLPSIYNNDYQVILNFDFLVNGSACLPHSYSSNWYQVLVCIIQQVSPEVRQTNPHTLWAQYAAATKQQDRVLKAGLLVGERVGTAVQQKQQRLLSLSFSGKYQPAFLIARFLIIPL